MNFTSGKPELNQVEWTSEPLSVQSTSLPRLILDKGFKAKMPTFEDDQSNRDGLAHSLDSEYGVLEVPNEDIFIKESAHNGK